jgi:hypothetical protein
MKNIEANVIGGNETNINSRHPYVQQLFHCHRNRVWEHSQFQLTCSKISKPGGTILGVTGNASGRIALWFLDPYGCFSSMTLIGKLGKHIIIILIYQVPRNSGASGNTTTHHQQVLQLKRDGEDKQNPRQQFCDALGRYLTTKIAEGHKIIIGGDFNKEIGTNMRGVTRVITKHNLVHVHQTKLGSDNEPATYSRGSTCLDYVFMTPNTASLVRSCGAELFNYCFFSDHQGLYVDLILLGLFDRNLSPLASPSFRDICSGTHPKICKYISELHQRRVANNASERSKTLKTNPDHTKAEALNSEITTAMLEAGKTCAQTAWHPISAALHTAQTKHRITQFVLTQLRTLRNTTTQIA